MFTELGYFGFILMVAGILLILVAFIPVNQKTIPVMYHPQQTRPVYTQTKPVVQSVKKKPFWKKLLFVVLLIAVSSYAIQWWRKKNGK